MGRFSSGVYIILNTVNRKKYIGSSVNVFGRLEGHRTQLRGNRHYNPHLQNAWNKYGEKAFLMRPIEFCRTEKMIDREQYWIDHFQCFKKGYNRSPTAGSNLGIKMPEEFCEKQRIRMLGVPMKDEVKEKIRDALTGKEKSEEHRNNLWKNRQGWKHSEESKEKISDGLRKASEEGRKPGPPPGWRHSDEAREKMSHAGKGKPKSPEHRANIAKALKGKKRPPEHCTNISKSKRGKR